MAKHSSAALFSLRGQKKARRPQALDPATRILVVAHSHPQHFAGGGELMAHGLFRQYRAQGYEASLIAGAGRINREPNAATPLAAAAEDEWLFVNDRFDYFMQSQSDPERLTRDFADLLRTLRPDIVHFHHTLRFGMEALAVVRRSLPQARIVYTLHDYIPLCHRDGQMVKTNGELCSKAEPVACARCFPEIEPARFLWRERFIQSHLALVDHFVAPSRFLAERYAQWGVPAEKITVIANGVDAGEPAPPRQLARGEARNRFAFLGQISAYKGVPVLLEAVQHLAARGHTQSRISLHGTDAFQPESFRQTIRSQLAAQPLMLRHEGPYRREQLPQIMVQADWVVVPSIWWENAPLVIAEALHHRRPVICSDIGGMAEMVQHGKNGLHFRAGSAVALADAMERAMAEENLWQQLSTGTGTARSMAHCAAEHLALFAHWLNRAPQRKESA